MDLVNSISTVIKNLLLPAAFYFLRQNSRTYFVFLLTSIGIATLLYIVNYRAEKRVKFSLKRLFTYLFPRSVFLHKSARLDYLFFVTKSFMLPLILKPVVVVLAAGSDRVQDGLKLIFGPGGQLSKPDTVSIAAYTLCMLIFSDFAKFWVHHVQHRWSLLWEFHKVHHSAEVLTPVTVYRMHPMDSLLYAVVGTLTHGLISAIFVFLHQSNLVQLTLWGSNIGLFAFYFFGYNLRHSHVRWNYPSWLSHLLISPAQHQVHHSDAARHYDKNFGFMFAFWDWMTSSIYIPKRDETITFGLVGEDPKHHTSLWGLYWYPFVRAYRLMLRYRSRAS